MCNTRTGQRKKVNAAEKEQLFHERDAIKLCFWSDVRIARVAQMRESFYDRRPKRVLGWLLSHPGWRISTTAESYQYFPSRF